MRPIGLSLLLFAAPLFAPGSVARGVESAAEQPLPDSERIGELIEDLTDADRIGIARCTLTKIGRPAVPALIRLVEQDENQLAIEILGNIGPSARSALPAFIEFLKRHGPGEDLNRAILQMGDRGVAAVTALLDEPNTKHRITALRLLSEYGPAAVSAVPKLRAVLADRQQPEIVRFWASVALGSIGPAARSAVPELDRALRDFALEDKTGPAKALGRIGRSARGSVPLLAYYLRKNRNGYLSEVCSEALGEIGAPSVPELIPILEHRNSSASELARAALVRIGRPAVPALLSLRTTVSRELQEVIDTTIAEIGEPAVADLLTAGEHSGQDDQLAIDLILARIEPAQEIAVPGLAAALESRKFSNRMRAAAALALIGKKAAEATLPLVETFRITNEVLLVDGREVRGKDVPQEKWDALHEQVIAALARIGQPAIRYLVVAMGHPDLTVRGRATEALIRVAEAPGDGLLTPKDETTAWLMIAMQNSRPRARQLAEQALRAIRPSGKNLARAGERGLPVLMAALADSDPEFRRHAIEALALLGDTAVPELAPALQSKRLIVRFSAAQALSMMGPRAYRATPAVVKATRIGDLIRQHPDIPEQLWNAYQQLLIQTLANIGEPIVEVIVAGLRHDDVYSHRALAAALALMGPEAAGAGDALVELTTSPDPEARFGAVAALANMRTAGAEHAPALAVVLQGRESDEKLFSPEQLDQMKRVAARGLARMGQRGAARLITALKSHHQDTRRHAAAALSLLRLRDELDWEIHPDVATLIESLDAEDFPLRLAALHAIRELGKTASEAVPKLMEMLQEAETDVAAADVDAHAAYEYPQNLVEALAAIGEPAVDSLMEGLLDEDQQVQRRCALALRRISPSAQKLATLPVEHLLAALHHEGLRDVATNALALAGDRVVDKLVEAANSDDHSVRVAVIKALGGPMRMQIYRQRNFRLVSFQEPIDPVEELSREKIRQAIVPTLTAAMDDDNQIVRYHARHSLRAVAPDVATLRLVKSFGLGALTEAMEDDDPQVRSSAIDAIGEMEEPPEQSAQILVEAILDADHAVRRSAARVIGRMPALHAQTVPKLRDLLKEKPDELHLHLMIAEALGGLGPHAAPAVPELVEALKMPNDELTAKGAPAQIWQSYRRRISDALVKIGEDAVPSLIAAFDVEQSEVRDWAARTVVRIGRGEGNVIPRLIENLDSDKRWIRNHAAWSLQQIDPDALERALQQRGER